MVSYLSYYKVIKPEEMIKFAFISHPAEPQIHICISLITSHGHIWCNSVGSNSSLFYSNQYSNDLKWHEKVDMIPLQPEYLCDLSRFTMLFSPKIGRSHGKYGNNRSRTENVTEGTWFSKSRLNDLEDIGQGQRSSHATHLLMLVIICTKYGKNPSRTPDATERTWFSRPMLNGLEDIGQGHRSWYATHPLILVIICAEYGKNPSSTVDFFFKVKAEKFQKFDKNSHFQILKKT